ncbi:putative coronin [Fusarium longipes]|uniref:Putative coronin n=1 Tax=Fusarium longipes TaxID=694270 RepID=A0A395S7A2_9HYPO|nr:putative coronin [Fusarium longipes]
MNEQKGSISAMASRYQDKQEDEEEDDDASSFEEVSRPAQRQAAPTAKFTPPAQSQTAPSFTPAVAKPSSPVKTPTTPAFSAPAASSSSAPSGGDSSFAEIKQLLEGQTKQIGLLTAEVEALKRKVSTGSLDQSERIRQLELELEEARS